MFQAPVLDPQLLIQHQRGCLIVKLMFHVSVHFCLSEHVTQKGNARCTVQEGSLTLEQGCSGIKNSRLPDSGVEHISRPASSQHYTAPETLHGSQLRTAFV